VANSTFHFSEVMEEKVKGDKKQGFGEEGGQFKGGEMKKLLEQIPILYQLKRKTI